MLAERQGERPFVATKAGRRLNPHVAEGYDLDNLAAFVDRSRQNLGMDRLDLVQLHCPPSAVYWSSRAFDALDELKARGWIADYGVSVETVEEACQALHHPGVVSVQIIFNLFRMKPAETFLPAARAKGVAVIARVPLASGLLTGKMTAASTFGPDDHRSFNREGAAFDKGETFSGVPFDVALEAVEALRPLVPEGATHGGLCPALDPDGGGDHRGHSGGQVGGPGGGEPGSRGDGAPEPRDHGRGAGGL